MTDKPHYQIRTTNEGAEFTGPEPHQPYDASTGMPVSDKPRCVLPERVETICRQQGWTLKIYTIGKTFNAGFMGRKPIGTGPTPAAALLALEAELEKREGK